MSKLTDGHINCITKWMKGHPGESPSITGLWRENGYEVLNGFQTAAKKRAHKILMDEGCNIDEKLNMLLGKRILPEGDPGPETHKPKSKLIAKIEPQITIKSPIDIDTVLTGANIEPLAKGLQGVIRLAEVMGQKAHIKITVEFI